MPNQPNFYHFTSILTYSALNCSIRRFLDGFFLSSSNSDVQSSEVIQIPKPWDGRKITQQTRYKESGHASYSREIPIVYIYIVSDSHSTTYHQLPMGNPIDVRYFSCINPWYSDLKQLFKMILKMAISIHIIHMKTYYHCYSWSPITIIFTLGYTKWELNHIKAKSLDFPVKLCRTPLFKVQSFPQRFWGPLLPSCKLDSNRLRFSSSRRLNRSSALLRLISAWVVGTFAKLLVLEFGGIVFWRALKTARLTDEF